MSVPENKSSVRPFNRRSAAAASISVAALLLTFWAASADYAYRTKVAAFAGVVFLYLIGFALIVYRRLPDAHQPAREPASQSPLDREIEARLLALEDANRFFGASLKFADVFRLVASRTSEIVPHRACAVYIADEAKKKLKLTAAVGDEFKNAVGKESDARRGFAGKIVARRAAQIENRLAAEDRDFDSVAPESGDAIRSAVGVPLRRGADVYGAFVLYERRENAFDERALTLLEAVGARVAPLLASSRAFEDTLANALTDRLTDLPNERAFYLVLENQIAEAQRFREMRPLTVLAMDISDFDELSRRHGPAAGDRLLLFAAQKIKNQLRQMDFLARASHHEFLAVLPTAAEETAREIVRRIEKTFVADSFEISKQETVNLRLSFGAASFGRDGEAAAHLLQRAVLRKEQSKTAASENKVLWFPKEYVN